MYDALADQGERAPIVAFPDGGGDSYWHDRADGDWGAFVAEEVIPRVAEEFGADPKRVAIGGISMGGFGAYDIARLHPGRFCAVGGHSPALWENGADSAAGAFDDAADFSRHDVIATARSDPDAFAGTALWIDGGREDPFQPGIEAFTEAITAAGLPISSHSPPGGHDGSYWSAHWDEYMGFYAKALARCK
jgi:S-formylglutathione hydrolase FrmB